MEHSRPETIIAVRSSAGMWRPKCATVVMSLPFLITAVTNAVPEQLAHPLHIHRTNSRDLARLTFERVAPDEGFVVDQHVRRPAATLRCLTRCRIPDDRVGERVRRVPILRFPHARLPCFPELLAGPVVDDGFDCAADFGGDLEVAFDHPVGRGPHPKRPGRVLARGPLGLIFAPGPHRDAPVPQRHVPLGRRREQLRFHRGIVGGGLGDQSCRARRQGARPHRSRGLRQRLELSRHFDRPFRLTRRYPGHSRAQLRGVAIVLVCVGSRVLDPLRGLAQQSRRAGGAAPRSLRPGRSLPARCTRSDRTRVPPIREPSVRVEDRP